MDSTPRKDGAFARWDSLSPASIPDILLSPPSHDLAVSLPASGSSRQRHVLLEDVTLRGDSSGSCPVAGFREAPSDRGSSECIRGVQERKGSSRGNVAGFTAQRTSTPAPSDAAGIAEGPGAGAGPPVPVPIPRLPPTAPSAGHHVSSLSSRCPKGVLHAERENLAPKSMQGMGMTCSRDINSGSGYLDDADSILERLAEKAKHAVAVAAAVDTGSGGSIQVPAPAPRTTVTEAATITTAPSPSFPGTSANEDIVDRRDEPDESVVAGGRRSGGARLAELCQEDKSKIARLMQVKTPACNPRLGLGKVCRKKRSAPRPTGYRRPHTRLWQRVRPDGLVPRPYSFVRFLVDFCLARSFFSRLCSPVFRMDL